MPYLTNRVRASVGASRVFGPVCRYFDLHCKVSVTLLPLNVEVLCRTFLCLDTYRLNESVCLYRLSFCVSIVCLQP